MGLTHPSTADMPPGFQVRSAPRWMPKIDSPDIVARVLFRMRLRDARRQLRRRGCTRLVVSLWRPRFAAALDLVPYDASCYHIDDEYSFSSVECDTDAREAALIQAVDQVFVTNSGLLEKKGRLNPQSLIVPNGVEFAKYNTPCAEPKDLRPIPHPRAAQIGVVKKQVDLDTMLEVARRNPHWSFVFVGPQIHRAEIGAVLDAMKARPNIYFLGEKSVTELPGYAQYMDARVLCYKIDDYTKYIYPLRLHESLATGVPCIGVHLPVLESFRSVVRLASSVDDWSAALAWALTPEAMAEPDREARRDVARRHDWDRLVHQMAEALGDRLGPAYRHAIPRDVPDASLAPRVS